MQTKLTHHFGKYATKAPDVHARGIELGSQQYFRRSIPKCNYFMRIRTHGYIESTRQTKICQLKSGDYLIPSQKIMLHYLNIAWRINEQILRFEIAMQYAISVTKVQRIEYLVHVAL